MFLRLALDSIRRFVEVEKNFAAMKTKKRTTVTVETFESIAVRLKQTPTKVRCENCRQPILELPVTKITIAKATYVEENVYLFVTEAGDCFLTEIL